MSAVDVDVLTDAIRCIRERAMRQVVVMVVGLQPKVDRSCIGNTMEPAFKLGYNRACMQIYDEIERMIAREMAAVDVGEYEPEGDAAEPVEDPWLNDDDRARDAGG